MIENRRFLKATGWSELQTTETDQKKGLPAPLPQLPYPESTPSIDLIPPREWTIGQMSVEEAIGRRRSHRAYRPEALSLDDLSFLLWATQGVSKLMPDASSTLRTAPSGGARHPLESYVYLRQVEGIDEGLYRYLPLSHQLLLIRDDSVLFSEVEAAFFEQYISSCAAAWIWTAIPYRTEWRYAMKAAKLIALDVGHVCQNLYLAATSIGAGVCAIGAYDQEKMDQMLGVDGNDEFCVYAATLGKI
jgi:SagB-type dehydrogenase family enzyme